MNECMWVNLDSVHRIVAISERNLTKVLYYFKNAEAFLLGFVLLCNQCNYLHIKTIESYCTSSFNVQHFALLC